MAAALRLPFRAVNRPGRADYDPGLQRHHLLPRQLLVLPAFARLFAALPPPLLGFDDFRRNGLLLPAVPERAARLALPLHRGPHRHYNALVIERVGSIERDWSRRHTATPRTAAAEALGRFSLLQRALHRRLLRPVRCAPGQTNPDPLRDPLFFCELDALAEQLWGATAERE